MSLSYMAVDPRAIIKVSIDGTEIDRSDWYIGGDGSIKFRPGFIINYGQTISVETGPADEWKFGDILTFQEPPHDAKFMFLADNEDDGAIDPIWVMSLFSTHDGRKPGHITTRNRSIFQRVETE